MLCRHVLSQFAPAARERVLALLVAGLGPGGLLVLDGWRADRSRLGAMAASGVEAMAPDLADAGIYRKAASEAVAPVAMPAGAWS